MSNEIKAILDTMRDQERIITMLQMTLTECGISVCDTCVFLHEPEERGCRDCKNYINYQRKFK